jgi:formylglycine-generating enzyme required for sulfatase activity
VTESSRDLPELKVGGPVDPEDNLYVRRETDDEFLGLLRKGEFVNIVTSRQMGKTSLVYKARSVLEKEGLRFAIVDLSSLGKAADAARYFRSLIEELASELDLDGALDVQGLVEAQASGTFSHALIAFFRRVVEQIPGPVVVVLDEIDSTLGSDELAYTDDLFTAIRSIYTGRPKEPAFKRLTFCLVGVATPNELIKARRTTPYNIGRTIWLTDFDPGRDDLSGLVQALHSDPVIGEAMLDRVIHWTGGQPYLTVWICDELRRTKAGEPSAVDAFIERTFTGLERMRGDTHFDATQRFLNDRVRDGSEVIGLYARVLDGKREADQPANPVYAQLRLSGLVRRDDEGVLVVRNRIYARLFDSAWVEKTRPRQALRRTRRFALVVSAVLVVALVGGAVYYELGVVPLKDREQARQALDEMGVQLSKDVKPWTEIVLRDGDRMQLLRKAAPYLSVLGSDPASGDQLALDLSGEKKVDLSVVASVAGLRRLDLSNTNVVDLEPLGQLPELRELDLSGTNVSDLGAIGRLRNLRRLFASNSKVADLSALKGLLELRELALSGAAVKNLRSLEALSRLEVLDVSSTAVQDVGALSGRTALIELNLARTKVSDLTPVAQLPSLRLLVLDGLGAVRLDAGASRPDLRVLRDPVATSPTGLRPGESFRECPECPEMVVVPAGRFQIGSPTTEDGRDDDESPQHEVRIATPLAVGKHEVRVDEWNACVVDGQCKPARTYGFGGGPRPVTGVSWDDARTYVAWLNRKSGESGQPYRLPSEAEWEYAARGGSTTRWYWGEDPAQACRYENVYDKTGKRENNFNWEVFPCDDGFARTAPVGTFLANPYGLQDASGNVYEWTEDCWNDSYEQVPADGTARTTGDCSRRVVRGGSWSGNPRNTRSADRSYVDSTNRYIHLGFRVARTLP